MKIWLQKKDPSNGEVDKTINCCIKNESTIPCKFDKDIHETIKISQNKQNTHEPVRIKRHYKSWTKLKIKTLEHAASRFFIINTGEIWIIVIFLDADFAYAFAKWNFPL